MKLLLQCLVQGESLLSPENAKHIAWSVFVVVVDTPLLTKGMILPEGQRKVKARSTRSGGSGCLPLRSHPSLLVIPTCTRPWQNRRACSGHPASPQGTACRALSPRRGRVGSPLRRRGGGATRAGSAGAMATPESAGSGGAGQAAHNEVPPRTRPRPRQGSAQNEAPGLSGFHRHHLPGTPCPSGCV